MKKKIIKKSDNNNERRKKLLKISLPLERLPLDIIVSNKFNNLLLCLSAIPKSVNMKRKKQITNYTKLFSELLT